MAHRWDFRWALGCVPRGTVFAGGTGYGWTPSKHSIHLPMCPPIPMRMSATGIRALEGVLIEEIRKFMDSLRRTRLLEVQAEYYSAYKVQR